MNIYARQAYGCKKDNVQCVIGISNFGKLKFRLVGFSFGCKQCLQSEWPCCISVYKKPGSHMSPMIGESLSVIIQGENSQRILLMSNITDNGCRRCRRHMRTRLKHEPKMSCSSDTKRTRMCKCADRKLCDDKFTWYLHKAEQVYCLHHANVQGTYSRILYRDIQTPSRL